MVRKFWGRVRHMTSRLEVALWVVFFAAVISGWLLWGGLRWAGRIVRPRKGEV